MIYLTAAEKLQSKVGETEQPITCIYLSYVAGKHSKFTFSKYGYLR